MTTIAILAAFGAVIVITAEYITHQQASQIAAKDQRIRQLEAQLAESREQQAQIVSASQDMWKQWAAGQ